MKNLIHFGCSFAMGNAVPEYVAGLKSGAYIHSNIESKHCMIGDNKQMFKLHNIDNVEDMKKYNIKNTDRGMDRPYSIVMSNDNKCLHKENKEISFRNCDNVKNQYWDYSNISGPNM